MKIEKLAGLGFALAAAYEAYPNHSNSDLSAAYSIVACACVLEPRANSPSTRFLAATVYAGAGVLAYHIGMQEIATSCIAGAAYFAGAGVRSSDLPKAVVSKPFVQPN